MNFKMRKLKAAAMLTCVLVAAGSITYVNNSEKSTVMAKTISDLEDEKAANDAEIAKLQKEIDDIDDEIANEEYKQKIIQDKLDVQTANLEIINTKINDINTKIDDTQKKIDQLEIDISNKQKDIDKGMEEFKERLRAMYVSGNDSLASALVGSTDFYDMLSKMELISQVAKHDDELVTTLKTQLEQFAEAQTQLDIAQDNLNKDLEDQQSYKSEFTAAIEELNNDYQESQNAVDLQKQKKDAAKSNINQYEADNKAMDDEITRINEVAASLTAKKNNKATSNNSNNNSSSNSNNSSSDDDNYSSSNDDADDSYDEPDNSSDDNTDSYDEPDSSDDNNADEPDTGGSNFSGSLSWPVPGHYVVSSGFGSRWGSFHSGMDISDGNTMGATITAAESGTVVLAMTGCTHNYGKDYSCGCNGGFGNYIMIDHGNGITTLYGHCSTVNVSVGQYVSRGEAIGTAGSTGWSTGAHLHFEVRVNGSQVDPAGYLY